MEEKWLIEVVMEVRMVMTTTVFQLVSLSWSLKVKDVTVRWREWKITKLIG